jgi:serine/threonine protein kinase
MDDASVNHEPALEDLVSLWQRRRAEGKPTTPAELCRERPGLLAELERRIAALERMNALAGAMRGTATLDTAGSIRSIATTPPFGGGDLPAVASLPVAMDLRDYELIEQLGKGGMGEVYRSCDPALERDLAIKVMAASLRGHAEAERRFLREARITGALQHPGIVAVYNLGRLADDRLHYTMRLVRGRTLADILQQEAGQPERLPSLLAIFEKVCEAVAYAHSKRVIHRDLKPGNIMVGKFGEVQVMDWGLAKLLSGDEGATAEGPPQDGGTVIRTESRDTPPEATQLGSTLGTPAYMAPEQAAGDWEVVDERADVFALGAILCEILTGAPPYRTADGIGLLRRARRGDLADALGRLEQCGVDAALTALCRECLNPDRDARPRDAGAVVMLVSEYQAEVQQRLRRAELERVAAETRAREEQARALVEQERAREALARATAERRARQRTLALAGVLLVLLAGGVAGIVAINREQQRTATERDEKQQALHDLEVEQDKTLTALAAEKRRRTQAREALDAMSSEVIDDWLGKQAQLSDEQKKYLEKALASYEEFAQETGEDKETRRGLAGAYLRIAKIRHKLGQMAEAEKAYRRSQELYTGLVAGFPGSSAYRHGLGVSLRGLGGLFHSSRRFKAAEAFLRDALAVFKQANADFPANQRLRYDLTYCHVSLASWLTMNRRSKEAESEYQAALVIMKQLVAEFPDNAMFSRALGEIQFKRCGIFIQNRQWTEAETAIRADLAVREPLVARFPTRADFRHDLARVYTRLGIVLDNSGRLSEAGDAYRKALPLLKQLANDFPSRPEYPNDVAAALTKFARASMEKQTEQARRLLEEALPYSQVAVEADPGNIDYLAVLYENYGQQVNVFLKLRDHAGVAAAADIYEPVCHSATDIYECACAYAACVKLAGEDARLSQAKQQELRQSYGDRAMNVLRRAVQFGYKDVANLKKDKHLDPLRECDEFKKLLADLEKPAS